METTELATTSHAKPLTKDELVSQVKVIQDVMKSVMRQGEHYGTIPGCGTKPTLLKPGAEKIMLTFRLAPDYEIHPLFYGEDAEDKVGYRVVCKITSIHTSRFMGSGVGECSTEEEKYRWRKAVSEDEYMHFKDNDEARIKFTYDGKIYQVRTNPRDLANTVLKMAKKRALVDAILTVCAASDIFTQDIEDTADTMGNSQTNKPTVTLTANTWVTATIQSFTPKHDKYPHKLGFLLENGQDVSTSNFSLPDGWDEPAIQTCLDQKRPIQFQFALKGKYKNFTKMRLYSPAQEPPQQEPLPEPEEEMETMILEG